MTLKSQSDTFSPSTFSPPLPEEGSSDISLSQVSISRIPDSPLEIPERSTFQIAIGLPLVAAFKLAALNTNKETFDDSARLLQVDTKTLFALRNADVPTSISGCRWGSVAISGGNGLNSVADQYISATLEHVSPTAAADLLDIRFIELASKHFHHHFPKVGIDDSTDPHNSTPVAPTTGRARQIAFFEHLGKDEVPVSKSSTETEAERIFILGVAAKRSDPESASTSLGCSPRQFHQRLKQLAILPYLDWRNKNSYPLQEVWTSFRNTDGPFTAIPVALSLQDALARFRDEVRKSKMATLPVPVPAPASPPALAQDPGSAPAEKNAPVVLEERHDPISALKSSPASVSKENAPVTLRTSGEFPVGRSIEELRRFLTEAHSTPKFFRTGIAYLGTDRIIVPKELRRSIDRLEEWYIERSLQHFSIPAAARILKIPFDRVIGQVLKQQQIPAGRLDPELPDSFREAELRRALARNTDLLLRNVIAIAPDATVGQLTERMILASLARRQSTLDSATELKLADRTMRMTVEKMNLPNVRSWKGALPYSMMKLLSHPLEAEKPLLLPIDMGLEAAQLYLLEYHLISHEDHTFETIARDLRIAERTAIEWRKQLPFPVRSIRTKVNLDSSESGEPRGYNRRAQMNDDDARADTIVRQLAGGDTPVLDPQKRRSIVDSLMNEGIAMTSVAWALQATLSEVVELRLSSLLENSDIKK